MHPVASTQTYVSVILPMAVPKPFTYYVPESLMDRVAFGKRVEVQFGRGGKLYTALVIDIHRQAPQGYRPKAIISVLDETPLIYPLQVDLWRWIAAYYCCTAGEVMNAALPANLKLSSETRLTLSPIFDQDYSNLEDKEYLIAEALHVQQEISINDVRKILDQQTVYPLIKRMIDKKIIYVKEDLKEKFSPKTVGCVRLQEPYASRPELLEEAFEKCSRSTRQVEALMAFVQLSRQQEHVRKQDIYQKVKVDGQVLKAIAKKGVFELYDQEMSRIAGYEEEITDNPQLSGQQERALAAIREQLTGKSVVLLHGVTGSGKTRIYIELIRETIERGEQVLYLLPEIALTTQLINRLQRHFGDHITVYHSRLNNNERVELWNKTRKGQPIIMGARSALFLPFKKLGLVVIDEEHDQSFKQYDPSPRYHGRDAGIYLAHLHGAPALLGTATPSIESYHNAQRGKYGLVEMTERFGGLQMPEIQIIDAKDELKKQKMKSHFTSVLIEEMQRTLERGEQVILFQNRRGFAPTYRCLDCGWHAECIHCDVSLTYHKFHGNLRCHYCGYQTQLPPECPACGNKQLTLKGFGTEKIEDELKVFFPEAQIGRMDLDTVRSKHAHARLINDFEEHRLQILVGTQMVTKGLDFESVGLVGVLSADQLLQFPDFRSSERGFQLKTQVSGRSGRKHRRGKVVIQAFNTAHPVLQEVRNNDFAGFFDRERNERQEFAYPPYVRLIKITLKHRKPQVLNDATRIYDQYIKGQLGSLVIGPAIPFVSRVRSYYLMDFLVKLPREARKIKSTKRHILEGIDHLQGKEGFSGVRVNVDVDPL